MPNAQTYREDKRIEQYCTNIKWLRPSSKCKLATLKLVGSHHKPQQRYQPISSDGRYSSRRNQRVERDLAWEDAAQEDRAEEVHHRHGVARLPLTVDLPDPLGHGEHAVTGDSVDQARGCDDRHAGTLWE